MVFHTCASRSHSVSGILTLILSAYGPRMKIKDIEQRIRIHYERSLLTSCWHVTKHFELNRESCLSECGIRPYEHRLEFKLSLPARL